jgi:hypothetical protein
VIGGVDEMENLTVQKPSAWMDTDQSRGYPTFRETSFLSVPFPRRMNRCHIVQVTTDLLRFALSGGT